VSDLSLVGSCVLIFASAGRDVWSVNNRSVISETLLNLKQLGKRGLVNSM